MISRFLWHKIPLLSLGLTTTITCHLFWVHFLLLPSVDCIWRLFKTSGRALKPLEASGKRKNMKSHLILLNYIFACCSNKCQCSSMLFYSCVTQVIYNFLSLMLWMWSLYMNVSHSVLTLCHCGHCWCVRASKSQGQFPVHLLLLVNEFFYRVKGLNLLPT